MLTAFAKGLRLGLLLQLSVGPVFIFVLQTAIARGIGDALAAVLAVTLVDAGYIILALLGVGTWLNQKQQLQTGLRYLGALVLLLFALQTFSSIFTMTQLAATDKIAPLSDSFTAAALLTLSNPLTIIFWLGILSAQATQQQFTCMQLVYFCGGCLSATFVFLSCIALAADKCAFLLTPALQQFINIALGLMLIIFACKMLRHKS